MRWISEVEDAKCIDDFLTSASLTGKTVLDFESLEFKIASGLRKIVTGNFKKQVTTAEGKAQSEKRSLTGRQIDLMIDDIFKISDEAILDFREKIKSPRKERQR